MLHDLLKLLSRRNLMRHLFTAIAAGTLLAAPALAQGAAPAGAYVSDKTHTTIQWQGLHNGLSWYTGRFTNFDIQLTFNPADVTKSKVTATIDPKSIETDYTRTRPLETPPTSITSWQPTPASSTSANSRRSHSPRPPSPSRVTSLARSPVTSPSSA
jgi:hypothetical protein